jgi:hypothetical protein
MSDLRHLIENDPDFTLAHLGRRVAYSFLAEGRNYGLGSPIEKVKKIPGSCQERIWSAEAEVAELQDMTPEDIERACSKSNQEVMDNWLERTAQMRNADVKMQAMIDKVKAWDAPEILQPGLKRVMLERLTQRLQGPVPEPPKTWLPGDWHAMMLGYAMKDVERAKDRKRLAEEEIAQRNAFVAALFEEFPLPGDDDDFEEALAKFPLPGSWL